MIHDIEVIGENIVKIIGKVYQMNRRSSMLNLLIAIFGTLLFAVGVNLFIVPIGLYNGGFVGFAQIIRTILIDNLGLHFGDMDIAGIISFLFNIPLFLLAYYKIGKEFLIKTFLCVLFQSIFLVLIRIPKTPIIEDPLTACFIGGIIVGGGTGITLRAGASGGGQDILGVYFSKKYNNFSVGKIAIFVNLIVYGICFFLFDISVVIYSVIYTLILSNVTDRVHIQNICMEVFIFTKTDMEEIQRYIREDLRRGSTYWEAKGGYSKETTNIIYAVISKYEYGELRERIQEIDQQAFLVCKEDIAVNGNFEKRM